MWGKLEEWKTAFLKSYYSKFNKLVLSGLFRKQFKCAERPKLLESTFLKHNYIFILNNRTQECLRSGHFVSVLHILMQLLRVCNHPDLINPWLPSSSFVLETLEFRTASLVLSALKRDLWKVRREVTLLCLI